MYNKPSGSALRPSVSTMVSSAKRSLSIPVNRSVPSMPEPATSSRMCATVVRPPTVLMS
ncbi:hypothetical protein D9M69_556890 [compost metagenome]